LAEINHSAGTIFPHYATFTSENVKASSQVNEIKGSLINQVTGFPHYATFTTENVKASSRVNEIKGSLINQGTGCLAIYK
jgi:hypothetical protein